MCVAEFVWRMESGMHLLVFFFPLKAVASAKYDRPPSELPWIDAGVCTDFLYFLYNNKTFWLCDAPARPSCFRWRCGEALNVDTTFWVAMDWCRCVKAQAVWSFYIKLRKIICWHFDVCCQCYTAICVGFSEWQTLNQMLSFLIIGVLNYTWNYWKNDLTDLLCLVFRRDFVRMTHSVRR